MVFMEKYYNAVLFDWDGTLAETIKLWLKAFKDTFKRYNTFPTEKDVLEHSYGKKDGSSYFGITNYAEFNALLYNNISLNYSKTPLFVGVKDTLSKLHGNGFKVCIVSSTKKSLLVEAIKYHQIDKYIDEIIGSDNLKNLKPNPEQIELAIKSLSLIKSKTVLVGDSDKDLIASKNAGIDSILFLPLENLSYNSEEELIKLQPTYMVSYLKDILPIFKL